MVQTSAGKLMKMFSWYAGAFSICMCFLKLQRIEQKQQYNPLIETLYDSTLTASFSFLLNSTYGTKPFVGAI